MSYSTQVYLQLNPQELEKRLLLLRPLESYYSTLISELKRALIDLDFANTLLSEFQKSLDDIEADKTCIELAIELQRKGFV